MSQGRSESLYLSCHPVQHLATLLSGKAQLPVKAAPGCSHTAASPGQVQRPDLLWLPVASWAGTHSLRCSITSQAPGNRILPEAVVLGGLAQAARHGAAAPSLTPCCKLISSGQLIYYLEIHFPLAAESLTSKQLAKVMNFSAAALKGAVNPFSSRQGYWRWWLMKTSRSGVPTLPAAPRRLLTPV